MVDQKLHYGQLQIPYKVFLIPKRRNKVAIHVHPDGTVQVDSPPGTPLADIKKAVTKRARWITKHITRIKEQTQYALPREYVSGESHFYLGKRYLLKVKRGKKGQSWVKLLRGQLQVTTNNKEPDVVKDLLWKWYIRHAEKVFARRIGELCIPKRIVDY